MCSLYTLIASLIHGRYMQMKHNTGHPHLEVHNLFRQKEEDRASDISNTWIKFGVSYRCVVPFSWDIYADIVYTQACHSQGCSQIAYLLTGVVDNDVLGLYYIQNRLDTPPNCWLANSHLYTVGICGQRYILSCDLIDDGISPAWMQKLDILVSLLFPHNVVV